MCRPRRLKIVDTDTKGLSFMGQRFVPDAFGFNQLVADDFRVPGRSLGPRHRPFSAASARSSAIAHLTEYGATAIGNDQNYQGQYAEVVARPS